MHTQTSPNTVRRLLTRGLATGLLLTQSALMLSAQSAPANPPADPTAAKDEAKKTAETEIVRMDAFQVVAGFSGSLAAAAEMKEKQVLISEVVAAEDIGKLPDISIAESLTRLPGLTTQRLNGRAQAVVIRGFQRRLQHRAPQWS